MARFHEIAISILILLSIPTCAYSQQPGNESGDVIALTPWELLGEDDGLGDSFCNISNFQSDLVNFAMKYLGSRYRAGGKTPKGFDCSGFTSFVFNNFDISLSPASRLQGKEGKRVTLDELQIGDLMFFSGRRGGNTVGHVGLVIDVDKVSGIIKFIHSSSSQGVVITTFPDGGYYSRRYLHSTRVIDDDKL
ncbi:MAG: C40 family peptidase [Duncaniella sp.]|nr:C40 family peptidase [Muribaculum sp.]MCM1255733.1 C40 family peptidase [Duncaniella sp.]